MSLIIVKSGVFVQRDKYCFMKSEFSVVTYNNSSGQQSGKYLKKLTAKKVMVEQKKQNNYGQNKKRSDPS